MKIAPTIMNSSLVALFILIAGCASMTNKVNSNHNSYSHNLLEETTNNKTITIELVHLQDSKGLKYIGGLIPKSAIVTYLQQMHTIIPSTFVDYRQQQIKRDHGQFHMTLINPYEYKETEAKKLNIGSSVHITLQGLAKVAKADKETFFVVVDSNQAQSIREKLGLPAKDFHITLGFKSEDIYDVSKGVERLIKY
jgi:hypothetical protein